MNASHRPALLLGHTSRLRTAAIALALPLVLATACALPGVGSKASGSNSHACADKLVQELSTNKTVSGLWACFDDKLQRTLHAYGYDGDGAFVNAAAGQPPVGELTTHYAIQQNGVVIYTVVVRGQDATTPAKTLVVVVWVDSDGKINNVTIASPDL